MTADSDETVIHLRMASLRGGYAFVDSPNLSDFSIMLHPDAQKGLLAVESTLISVLSVFLKHQDINEFTVVLSNVDSSREPITIAVR